MAVPTSSRVPDLSTLTTADQASRLASTNPVGTLQVLAEYERERQASNGAPTINGATAFSGLITEYAADSVVAHSGGTQAAATAIVTQTTRVITVAAVGDSVRLPVSAPGMELTLINHGANAMQVFGAGTDTINDVATATGVSQMAGSVVIYTCTTAGAWYTEGLATGYSGSFQTISATDAITAHAGGGQGSAVQLTTMLNRVTVVGTAADSVKLPLAAPGMSITVTNATASTSMNVFPATGDQINALGANAAFALAGTKTATFNSTVAGQWHSLLTA
jgi:hypothetical protein